MAINPEDESGEMDFEAKGLVRRLKAALAQGLIVEKDLNDPSITEKRRRTCWECDFMDKQNITCNKCGCMLEVKTKSLVNVNPETGKSEITHCPDNRWQDKFSKSYFKQLENGSSIRKQKRIRSS